MKGIISPALSQGNMKCYPQSVKGTNYEMSFPILSISNIIMAVN